jgi:integral membrane protein (TIGR01906 family)
MLDVRLLTRKVLNLWWLLIALVIGASYYLWKDGNKADWFVTIRRGGNLTIALIFGILFVVTFNFKELFTQFHKIFFEGDSWLFLMSDNLIRLFPMRFWRDLFIFIGGLSIFLGDLLAFISKKYFKKHPPIIEQKAQE